VPFVEIVALYDTFFELGITKLESPAATNAPWSMKAGRPVNSEVNSITFRVSGYDNEEMKWEEKLFYNEISVPLRVTGDTDVTGIVLNVN